MVAPRCRGSHPRVDQSLINAVGRAVGREGVPEDVPATELVPFAFLQGPLEMIVSLVASQRTESGPVDAIASGGARVARHESYASSSATC